MLGVRSSAGEYSAYTILFDTVFFTPSAATQFLLKFYSIPLESVRVCCLFTMRLCYRSGKPLFRPHFSMLSSVVAKVSEFVIDFLQLAQSCRS